jgi:glycosyltransferase involved in cell wall biosynthesis
MNLLYVCGTYMPASGGAEISMFTLLRHLARAHQVTVVTRQSSDAEPRFSADVHITVHGVPDKASATHALRAIIDRSRPDVIVTQNAWSDVALRTARSAGIPAVFFARTAYGTDEFASRDEYRCDLIISNSHAVASFIEQEWSRTSVVIPSPIESADYRVRTRTDNCLTMVNPIEMKGGHVVAKLVQLLPDQRFLIVRGWNHLRTGTAWNNELLRDLAAGLGGEGAWDPGDADFSTSPNVIAMDGAEDMRRIYERTSLLLVPSIRAESCPRVAIEAMCSGIPVIGSSVGGIPEAIGAGGSIVQNFMDPTSWASAIRAYEDPETYAAASREAREQVRRHDPAIIARRVADAIADMLTRQAAQGDVT